MNAWSEAPLRAAAPRRIAIIGNALPRRCGIATFTTNLHDALIAAPNAPDIAIFAINDGAAVYAYPPSVAHELREDRLEDYIEAAAMLNAGGFDLVCLQHEYGIFGGPAGCHIVALLSRLTMPLVTTLHTVLANPTPAQRAVMADVLRLSARVVVMAEKARELLHTVHATSQAKIDVIPHGIPDAAFTDPAIAKARLGFEERQVILTFGLLSPNKGIEVVIDAMPAILARCPNAVYVVQGATHPNLLRDQGEAYRRSLLARAAALGIASNVVLLDRFVDNATLLDLIAMSDVYVTPYLNEAQMTSGTLAYSFGLGKAVVSTPYWHARELLADNRGVLVPFGDAPATANAIATLLTDDALRTTMRRRAYAASRAMTWPRTAARYTETFAAAIADTAHTLALPPLSLTHFLSLCDDTGLYQHAIHAVPDRAHGYCVDDNARALLLACALNTAGDTEFPEALTARFAAFVQHAFNPDRGRFRNFLGFDRQWREAIGSEDSHGRTIWALGVCAATDVSPARREWAAGLFAAALPAVAGFTAPRAWAFALLGVQAACTLPAPDPATLRLRVLLADRLVNLLAAAERPDWTWFEAGLAYDNARLCQALLAAAAATGNSVWRRAGLRSLRWLCAVQTADRGHFRPVGSMNFATPGPPARHFDQQPLEAAATISACRAAAAIDPDPAWPRRAAEALLWFTGANDLGIPLVDPLTGACRDGLHPDRANQNLGAESALSWLLALAELRGAARAHAPQHQVQPI